MVESVTVPLEDEVKLACGLTLKLRHLNQAHSSAMDRTSITLTQGSDWQELTLDLRTQRRWKDYVITLEQIVTPARAKRGAAARQGSASFRIEQQPQQHRAIELEKAFTLSLHDIARLPDGSTLFATEIGPYVTELGIARNGEAHTLELGELGFGRWPNFVISRNLVEEKVPWVAQLTIRRASEPAPRLRYGESFELQPGESVVGPDGLQLALGFLRNVANDPCVEVQLRLGTMFSEPQIYRSRAQEIRLGETYMVQIRSVQAPKNGLARVTLRVDKQGSSSFEFGREFRLRPGQSARGPEAITIAYPEASHIHFTNGKTEGYLDFQIVQAGRPHLVRVRMPDGSQSSRGAWDNHVLAVRADQATSSWAIVIDKKP